MKQKYILLAMALMMSNMSVQADPYKPVPHCYQPSKPLWLAGAKYQQRYEFDVERYQSCIKLFIKKQQDAVQIHTQAAQKALKTWNDFIKEK